jgi:hypothetical protein
VNGVLLTALVLASAAGRRADVATDIEAEGTHYRVQTDHGPVHLFRPAGYDRRTAGVVVYVHGLYTRIDQAWSEQHLATQFAASGANALFIAPEAPEAADEPPAWTDLESLIATALARARLRRPPGPVVAVGHSGAYRTLVEWLGDPALRTLILIDALYGKEDEFRAWLDADPAHKMTLIVKGTARWADPFVRGYRRAITLPRIPDSFDELSRAERTGKTLPVVLRRTALGRVPLPPPPTD